MVLSLSDPQVVVVWFVWQWGKAGDRPDAVSTQTKACLEPSLRGRSQYNQFVNSSPAGSSLQWMAPESFGYLEHTRCAVSALTKSVYFKGNPVSLTTHHPTQAPQLKCALLGLISGLQPQLPDCQGCQHPLSPEVEDSEN